MDEMTFEQALAQLELTVEQLERGELPLDEALALFERGQKLAARCARQLDDAALRVEQLSADGEIVTLSGEQADESG